MNHQSSCPLFLLVSPSLPPMLSLSLSFSEQVDQDCIGGNHTLAEARGAELNYVSVCRSVRDGVPHVNNHSETFYNRSTEIIGVGKSTNIPKIKHFAKNFRLVKNVKIECRLKAQNTHTHQNHDLV